MKLKNPLFRNKALTDMGVYYVSTAINQAVPFLLLPVFTLYFQPGDFGFINTFTALLLLATSVFSGLSITISKNYYTQDRDHIRLLIGNLYMTLIMGTALIFILSLVLVFIFDIRPIPTPYFLAVPLVALFYMSLEFLKIFFKTSKRTLAFSVLTFSEVLVNVSISLILVIGFSWHWRGRVAGIMSSMMIFGTIALLFFIKKEKTSFSFKTGMIKEILKVGLPLIPLGLSVMIMRRSGVLFVDSFLGKAEAGLYGVALNLASIILFLSVPIINVWHPYLYEKLSHGSGAVSFSRLYHKAVLLCMGVFLISLVFSLFSGDVLGLMTTKAFYPAGRFIPWIAFGFCMWGMTGLLTPFLIHYNRQTQVALIASGSAAVNLGLNCWLIGRYGTIGAAASFFAANTLSALVMFAAVRRIGKLPFFPDLRLLLNEARGICK